MKATTMNAFKAALLGVSLVLAATDLSAQTSLPAEIGVKDLGSGNLFVDDAGHTLYTFKQDREQPGTSTCIDECAETWPPVIASSNATAAGDWSTVARPDGNAQWAYKGQPAYTYVKDTHPGAIVGEKVSGFWDVLYEPVDTPPDILIQATVVGQTLTTSDGHTIYANDGSCTDACLENWLPVDAPWMGRPLNGNWSITERPDGLTQWAYKNQPLYSFKGDFRPGDMNGAGSDDGWSVVVLKNAPDTPSWVTFQESDIGPVLANNNRMTLYYLLWDIERVRRETCGDECIKNNWDPVTVAENEKPVGNWTHATMNDGRLQWMYMGNPVYTFRNDKLPGDVNGDKFGTGSDIRGGWGAILKETLVQKLSS